jgi:hypothetical protein
MIREMRPALHAALLLALATSAVATPLPELLQAVAANARFDTPARADVRIECTACKTAATPAVLIGRGDTLYVEVKDGARALVRPGEVWIARDGKAAKADVGHTLADTDVLLEDLAVFTPAALKTPQVSDDGPAGVVVTAAPAFPSAWVLVVHTIDPERNLIVRTLRYRDQVNNLAATQRSSKAVRVANGWRPQEITVESLRKATTTTLKLAWREAPEAPAGLFEPSGLEKPSGLSWP